VQTGRPPKMALPTRLEELAGLAGIDAGELRA
jgi:hypothetical protein